VTFLHPFILWGLPLISIPVIIHFINRMRYRSIPWAAMMFLLSATRHSTRYARLRQILILCCRVLAVLTLILALSRPLAGGWMGWLFAPAPDTILLLLDRSATMERETSPGQPTKRQQALKLFADAGRKYEGVSRIFLIESVQCQPQEIAGLQVLPELASVSATDTSADIPSMLQAGLEWLNNNKVGTAEIWVASDLQASNWRPADSRWKILGSYGSIMSRRLRARLLALPRNTAPDASVSIQKVTRHRRAGQSELDLELNIQRDADSPSAFPLVMVTDGIRSQVDVKMPNLSLVMHQRVNLGPKREGGWCQVELPSDSNSRNNCAYWAYPSETTLHAIAVGTDTKSLRFLQLATAPSPREMNLFCETVNSAELDQVNWKENALVVWQDSLPEGEVARHLLTFLERGGTAIFFPPGNTDSRRFAGMGWGELEKATTDKPYRITRWEEKEGPLAKTEEGLSLPLSELTILHRQRMIGNQNALAVFADGQPFLARQAIGKGSLLACASLPRTDWSNLSTGTVLVPLMQRLMATGAQFLNQSGESFCGEWSPPAGSGPWKCVDSTDTRDPCFRSGVYRSGNQFLALNRPLSEDEKESMDIVAVKALFGDIPVQIFEEKPDHSSSLQSEIWRTFLIAMLVVMLLEGFLVMPTGRDTTCPGTGIPPTL
jgi:hypothetical protein